MSATTMKARLVELRHFAGLTIEQSAVELGLSTTTAHRYWTYARAWLHQAIISERSTSPADTNYNNGSANNTTTISGRLIIDKTTTGGNGTFSFNVTGPGGFSTSTTVTTTAGRRPTAVRTPQIG